MYAKVITVGRLGRDPDSRFMPNGKQVTSFTLACSREYTSEGEKVKETTWFRVTVFGNQAGPCSEYLKKGSMVLVEGHLVPDKKTGGPPIWMDKDGNPRSNFELTASTVRFLSPAPTLKDENYLPLAE